MSNVTLDSSRPSKVAPVYIVADGDMLLAASVERVWPFIVNYPSWQGYSIVQHISGPADEEGELVLLRKDEEGFEFPPYYARTVKKEPRKRIIWKTYPEKARPGEEFFGIVDFKVEDENGKTRFRFDVLYEFNVPYEHEQDLQRFRDAQKANFNALFSSVFPKLRRLVEKA